jgi:hypothetical protein
MHYCTSLVLQNQQQQQQQPALLLCHYTLDLEASRMWASFPTQYNEFRVLELVSQAGGGQFPSARP